MAHLRRRPADWSPAKALELANDTSQPFKHHLREIAGPMGADWHTLYKEIERWRLKDPAFDELYNEAMVARGVSRNAGGVVKFTRELRLKFLTEYIETGKRLAACRAAEIDPSTIARMLNPNERNFDPFFAQQYADAEAYVLGQVEDDLMGDVAKAREAGDFKTSALMAMKILERRDPERWSPRMHMRHEHTGSVRHLVTTEHEALGVLAEDFHRMFGQKDQNVIEGEVEEVAPE